MFYLPAYKILWSCMSEIWIALNFGFLVLNPYNKDIFLGRSITCREPGLYQLCTCSHAPDGHVVRVLRDDKSVRYGKLLACLVWKHYFCDISEGDAHFSVPVRLRPGNCGCFPGTSLHVDSHDSCVCANKTR